MKASRWLLLILLIALLVRGVALWAARDARPVLDEKLYLLRANALLDGRGFVGSYQSWVRHPGSPYMIDLPQYPGAYQPPGYVAFLAGVLAATGRSVLAVKCAQVLLSTAAVALVYLIGRNWFDRRHGLLAALLCALYPNLIAFSHYLWTETLFIFLLLLVVWLLTRTDSLPGIGASLAVGVVLALTALTRSAIVYFVPLLLAWMLVVHRRHWRAVCWRLLAIVAAMALVIAPWTVRNYRVHHGFVLIDTNGPFNLWRGNALSTFRDRPGDPALCYAPPFDSLPMNPVGEQSAILLTMAAKRDLGTDQPTDLQVAAYATDLALEHITVSPAEFVQRAWIKMIDMWNPTSFLLRSFRFQAYGPVNPDAELLICWAAVLSYLAAMVLGLIGWFCWWRDRRAWLVFLLVFFFCAIHAVAFGLTRFRLPLMPFIILLAAHTLWWTWDAVWPRVSGSAATDA